MSDRLDILKTKCEEEIRATEEKLRVLKAKLANLVSLALESEKLANPESEPDKYADMGLTDAVWDAVKVLAAVRTIGVSPVEIKNYLLSHGFKPADNFETAVYTVLGRLVEGEKIVQHTATEQYWGGALGRSRRFRPIRIYRPNEKFRERAV